MKMYVLHGDAFQKKKMSVIPETKQKKRLNKNDSYKSEDPAIEPLGMKKVKLSGTDKIMTVHKPKVTFEQVKDKLPKKKVSAPSIGKEKKKRRYRPGTLARREIVRLQTNRKEPLLRKRPFQRLTRSIATELKSDVRFTAPAIDILKNSAEMYLDGVVGAANAITTMQNRDTLDLRSFRILEGLRTSHSRCLQMMPLLPDKYNDWFFLKERLERLGFKYRELMASVKDMTEDQIANVFRLKLIAKYTELLENNGVKFSVDGDDSSKLETLETIYNEFLKHKRSKKKFNV